MQISGVEQATGELRAAILAGERNGLEKIGAEAQRRVVEKIRDVAPGRQFPTVSTGNLANAVFHGTESPMTEFVDVAPPADVYGPAIEFGSVPHMPPVEADVPWVQRKFGATDEKSALEMAWRVAQTIRKRGFQPGIHAFERTAAELEQLAPEILEREIAEACDAAGFGGAR